MAAAKTDYDFVQNFGLNYVKVATMLVAYWTGVVGILNNHSTCGKSNMAKLSCKYNVAFEALASEVNESMFNHAKKLRETMLALPEKCENPTPNKALWPWNQKCDHWPGKCNYEYLMLMPESDQKATVNGCEEDVCKMLITETYYQSDITQKCEKINAGTNTTFYGGFIGWQEGQNKLPKDAKSCDEAATLANKGGHNYYMFAIPGYVYQISCHDSLL